MKFYRLHCPEPIVYGNKKVVGENLRVVGREAGKLLVWEVWEVVKLKYILSYIDFPLRHYNIKVLREKTKTKQKNWHIPFIRRIQIQIFLSLLNGYASCHSRKYTSSY